MKIFNIFRRRPTDAGELHQKKGKRTEPTGDTLRAPTSGGSMAGSAGLGSVGAVEVVKGDLDSFKPPHDPAH
jgi:hypothetical protein